MRLAIILVALFFFSTPFVFPQTPLAPVEEVHEKTVYVVKESTPVVERTNEPVRKEETVPATKPEPIASPSPPQKEPVQVNLPPPKADSLAAILEEKIRVFTNTERSRRDLQILEPNSILTETARAHSADMLARDFFEHENPDGCSSSCRATNAGYSWRMIGENLYMLEGFEFSPEETAAMIVSGWMESPGHRANILRDGYTETGVGVVVRGRTIYATALYATPR